MTKTLPFAILASAALLSGGAAFATTPPAKAAPAHHAAAAAKPAGLTATRATAPAAGRMVTTKTATGKTVTYDCSKAGNATKTACKK